ncbi:MAG: hypothetical protein RR766_00170 [Longicatena sp.]
MDKSTVLIPVTDIERRIIISALEQVKFDLKSKGHNYDYIDDITLKVCDAKTVKEMNIRKNSYEEYSR